VSRARGDGGERARLFVALSLPEVVTAELARWARAATATAGGIRRLAPQSMHITLCFLGEQSLGDVEELAALLSAAAVPVAAIGQLTLGAPLWLPPRRPRALAVAVGDPDGGLGRLRALLAREIAATVGWKPGRERFRSHVTVARMRPLVASRGQAGRSARRAAGDVELAPTPQLAFVADTVVLLRSHLEPDGARYEALARVGGW